nr:hypothetical protein [uncultured Campylobacter sp.]
MNAARDTPALFVSLKLASARLALVGEILRRATNYKTQLIRAVLI